VTSDLLSAFLWIVVRKTVQAAGVRPAHDLDALTGLMGEAKSNIHDEGSVYVAGEMWSARSDNAIPEGTPIRVVRREGFILVVEKDSPSNTNLNKEN
jgi:membrane-bound ClpP family serine protease